MNYSEIVAAALSYADRNDSATTGNMDTFLRVVESRINRVLRNEEQGQVTSIALVANTESYALPSDFAGARLVMYAPVTGDPVVLMYVTPEDFYSLSAIAPDDSVAIYTFKEGKIYVYDCQSFSTGDTLSITYFKKIPALTAGAPNNWISDLNPDLYISGLLVEIASFVKNPAAAEMWNTKFAAAIDEVISANWSDKWSGNTLVICTL